mgnify:CR=1 FL=1
MATCPNKNSKEWKEILSEAQNNEQIAMDLWIKKGFNQQEELLRKHKFHISLHDLS